MSGGRGAPITATDPRPAQRAQLGHYVGALVGVGVAYYLGARLGLSLSLVERNVTPLWPPTGIAVATFLLVGRKMWPAVAIAALVVNVPISAGLLSAAATALGNTLAPLVAAALLLRVGFRRQLDRRRDALAIVFLGALASMLISATIGAGTLVISGAIPASDFVAAWGVWWTGDAMGVLVVAPFLLCLPLYLEHRDWSWARWVEAGAILVVVTVVTAWAVLSDLNVLFLALPVLGWASWRLQLRGAAPAALVASLIATWAAARGIGPFDTRSLFDQMLTLQAFNVSVALTSFFFAALVSERMRAAAALEVAAAQLEERVRQRTDELTVADARLVQEIRGRSQAQEQLGRQELRAQREHHIAETLQRSLLPDRLPEIPGIALAARYVPATAGVQVGGDWYDVMQLPGGLIGLAIGDVAGHGLQAAATMGQLRMSLRAYAMQDPSPGAVIRGVHQIVAQLPMFEMATLTYLVFDPATRRLRFANAGHPPPLVVSDGASTYLGDGLSPPVGVAVDDQFTEAGEELAVGATLLLYTDGLVERRGMSIRTGLDRLMLEAGANSASDLEQLCDLLLSSLVERNQNPDDIALVAMRPLSLVDEPLRLDVPAEPQALGQIRATLGRWLRELGVDATAENEVVVACGEACANVVQHAYRAAPGAIEVTVSLVDESVEVSVRDRGQWRPGVQRDWGRGFSLMGGLMDSVEVEKGTDGTRVLMRRRVQVGAPGE